MSEESSKSVEEALKRRTHRVGTGASNARGHLDNDAGPSTNDAEKDIKGRIRRMGTGGSDHPGEGD